MFVDVRGSGQLSMSKLFANQRLGPHTLARRVQKPFPSSREAMAQMCHVLMSCLVGGHRPVELP